jgi:hypothetical protein
MATTFPRLGTMVIGPPPLLKETKNHTLAHENIYTSGVSS